MDYPSTSTDSGYPPDSESTETNVEESNGEVYELTQGIETSFSLTEAECTLGECHEIYPQDDHIKQRVGDERIIGTLDQFCAAFYHVPRSTHQYRCLDQRNCIIAKKNYEFKQPIIVAAVVKFENPSGKILYEARYTNCRDPAQKLHAEDFFKKDIQDRDGMFNKLIQHNPKGTITLYLTLQPCHKSTKTNHTKADQSCCDILRAIVNQTLRNNGREIDLCVKAAHQNKLGPVGEKYKDLKRNAVEGIRQLMRTKGVNVSGMTQGDWDYLFTLTKDNEDRKRFDQEVESTLRTIEENQE